MSYVFQTVVLGTAIFGRSVNLLEMQAHRFSFSLLGPNGLFLQAFLMILMLAEV